MYPSCTPTSNFLLAIYIGTTQVDKTAANRFIKHAISQAQIDADAAGVSYPPTKASSSTAAGTVVSTSFAAADPSNSTSVRVPVKVTSKMLEREEWQKRVDEAGSEEEEELGGWEGNEEEKSKSDVKGKGKFVDNPPVEQLGSKRGRSAIDSFAASGEVNFDSYYFTLICMLPGYGDDSDHPSDSHVTKKRALSPEASSVVDPSASTNSTPATKAEKKSRKKQKAKTDRGDRVSQLLAEVAASQGVMVTSGESGDDDQDMISTSSAPGSPAPMSIPGSGGKKTEW